MIILPTPIRITECINAVRDGTDLVENDKIMLFNMMMSEYLVLDIGGTMDLTDFLRPLTKYPVNIKDPLLFTNNMFEGLKALKAFIGHDKIIPVFYLFTDNGILIDLAHSDCEYIDPAIYSIWEISDTLLARKSWTGERSKVAIKNIMDRRMGDFNTNLTVRGVL